MKTTKINASTIPHYLPFISPLETLSTFLGPHMDHVIQIVRAHTTFYTDPYVS